MALARRFGKKVFFGRFQKPWRWPERVAQDGWERVTFAREDGARLAGVFGAARTEARGAVVLAHPMGVAAKGFWLKHGHADLLRDRGFHVLAFDFNGFGESESVDYGFPADVLAAGHYLRERTKLPIGVVGASFGAGYALCSMEREQHPFRAAVLEGTFPTLPYYWRKYPLPRLLLRLSQFVAPSFERELRPIRAAAAIKHQPSVLIIQGSADEVSPPHVGDDLRAAMEGRASVAVWNAEGADHAHAFRDQRDEYAQRVTDFLGRSLAAG